MQTRDIIKFCTGGKPHPMAPKRIKMGKVTGIGFDGLVWEMCTGFKEVEEKLEPTCAVLFYCVNADVEYKWFRKLSKLFIGQDCIDEAAKYKTNVFNMLRNNGIQLFLYRSARIAVSPNDTEYEDAERHVANVKSGVFYPRPRRRRR